MVDVRAVIVFTCKLNSPVARKVAAVRQPYIAPTLRHPLPPFSAKNSLLKLTIQKSIVNLDAHFVDIQRDAKNKENS